MSKVGILTFHRAYNYGAVLQAYALQEAVRRLGHEPEIIDHPIRIPTTPLRKKILRSPIDNLKKIVPFLKNKATERKYRLQNRQRRSVFEHFVEKQYALSPDASSPEAWEACLRRYDAVVVGSDQVWNTGFLFDDPAFFLECENGSIRKFSYAASFGTSEIAEEYRERFGTMFASMKHISVREEEGADMIQRYFHRKAEVVLDPTLLHDASFWLKLSENDDTPSESYILTYVLGDDSKVFELARTLKRRLRCSLINIVPDLFRMKAHFQNSGADRHVIVAPENFPALIAKARLVLTNSFHGTVFSTNLRTPFLTVRDDYNGSMWARIDNFLSRVRLQDRMILLPDEAIENDPCEIDFENADKTITAERIRSTDFLAAAITDSE